MPIFEKTAAEQKQMDTFLSVVSRRIEQLSGYETYVPVNTLVRVQDDLIQTMEHFYRNDRKLNIGIIGQVKAGKSTFLNTLLFEGKEILPTARTPKTAALTKIEYAEENQICVEYYRPDEWRKLEEYAESDLEDNEHIIARETMKMVAESGVDPYLYLNKEKETFSFPSLDSLMGQLNEYVGENGTYTPMVKNVILRMNKPELAEISVVDTPGMNDAIASRTECTRTFIKECDVVFFLSRGSQFLDVNDMKLLSNQIPQEGVANLILICSKLDEALQDELRKCGSVCATIEKVKEKLKEQVNTTFLRELQNNGALLKFIGNCSEPIFISSMLYNMSKKQKSEFSRNEAWVYKRVNKFGDLTPELMCEVGNMHSVRKIFSQITAEKDQTLQERAQGVIPTAKNKWNSTIKDLKRETEQKKILLESGDKETLEKQKKAMEFQIYGIKDSLETVLFDLKISLEQAKAEILRKLRESCRENAKLQERTGTEYHTNRYKVSTGHLWWKSSHYEYSNYTTTYTYLSTSDALENIHDFGFNACSQIESAFYKAVDIKATKRKLMQTILDNFDSSDENFDVNHFRHLTEMTLNKIEFPVIQLNVDSFIQTISGQFSGEVKDSSDRAKLKELLSKTMNQLFETVSKQFTKSVTVFRSTLDSMQDNFSTELLEQIQQEFGALCKQVEDKTNAIAKYDQVLTILSKSAIA